LLPQQFQRNGAPYRLELFGAIDLAHAAAAEQRFDAVAPHARAGGQRLACLRIGQRHACR
jgi:hypothetical protein